MTLPEGMRPFLLIEADGSLEWNQCIEGSAESNTRASKGK